jgi:hypothetical protein
VTPQQLTLPVQPPPLWSWARLVLQATLTPEQMARVLAEARRAQCSRVEAYERLKEEGRL